MLTKIISVNTLVEVTLDETKFDAAFLEEFADNISDYNLDGHFEHLAWLAACREVGERDFVEGYGPLTDFGVKFNILDTETEIKD